MNFGTIIFLGIAILLIGIILLAIVIKKKPAVGIIGMIIWLVLFAGAAPAYYIYNDDFGLYVSTIISAEKTHTSQYIPGGDKYTLPLPNRTIMIAKATVSRSTYMTALSYEEVLEYYQSVGIVTFPEEEEDADKDNKEDDEPEETTTKASDALDFEFEEELFQVAYEDTQFTVYMLTLPDEQLNELMIELTLKSDPNTEANKDDDGAKE